MQRKIIYYESETSDDFSGTHISGRVIDENYRYLYTNVIRRALSFFLYYFIAFPIVWLIERVLLGVRFVNREAVREYRNTPFFLYGNHTGWYDAFTPNLISMPRRNYILVSSDAVSVRGLSNIVEMLGGVPVPTSIRGMRNFKEAIDRHHESSNITVYPEAHIWPYYTGVRQFSDASFSYPAKYGCPVFAFFTAYTKPKGPLSFLRRANMTVYVSDPIFPDEGLSEREARKNLRDKVYRFMLEKSKLSNYEVYEYRKRMEQEDVR